MAAHAHSTTAPNRRSLLVVATAATLLPAAAASTSPLFELGRRYKETLLLSRNAEEATSRAFDRYERRLGTAPSELLITHGDARDFGSCLWGRVGKPLSDLDYDAVKAWIGRPDLRNATATNRVRPRAEQLIAAYEAWRAHELETSIRTGLREACEVEDDIATELLRLEDLISSTPCRTLEDGRVKALVVANSPLDCSTAAGRAAQDIAALLLQGGLN